MARQKGVLKYVGTLGDVRHFKIKGQEGYFAGMVGGPSGEQVLSAPEFERTRENMNEFGACAKAGKSVRTGLSQIVKQMSDTQVAGRLTAIMKKINLENALASLEKGIFEVNVPEKTRLGAERAIKKMIEIGK